MRSLDGQLLPDRLKVITQQVEEEQSIIQSQTLLRLQQIQSVDRQTHSPKVRNTHTHTHWTYLNFMKNIYFKIISLSPGAGSSSSPCLNTPPDSHCPSSDTDPAPPPPRYRGDHEPTCPQQHCVHVQTKPGYHRAGMCLFYFIKI